MFASHSVSSLQLSTFGLVSALFVAALAWIAVRNIDRQHSRSKQLRSMIGIAAALGHWQQLLFALPLYLAGTVIRIRDEEALLREQFGEEHARYVREVPALLPLIV